MTMGSDMGVPLGSINQFVERPRPNVRGCMVIAGKPLLQKLAHDLTKKRVQREAKAPITAPSSVVRPTPPVKSARGTHGNGLRQRQQMASVTTDIGPVRDHGLRSIASAGQAASTAPSHTSDRPAGGAMAYTPMPTMAMKKPNSIQWLWVSELVAGCGAMAPPARVTQWHSRHGLSDRRHHLAWKIDVERAQQTILDAIHAA